MTFGLCFEDSLEGALNFIPWKEMITFLLKEFDLCEIVGKIVTIPTNLDPLDEYNKKNVKEKRIIIDVVKDHIMPHVTDKI